MEKPIVLKHRFRLDWPKAIILAVVAAMLIWSFTRDPWAALMPLPGIVLTNIYTFFPRVILNPNSITVCQSYVCGDLHRFHRIVSYLIRPSEDKVEVQLTLEQRMPQDTALFGIALLRTPGKPVSSRARALRFTIEPNQAELMLDYLRAQGAVLDRAAQVDWRQTQILLASGRELRRLTKEREEFSRDEVKQLLAETKAKISETEKTL